MTLQVTTYRSQGLEQVRPFGPEIQVIADPDFYYAHVPRGEPDARRHRLTGPQARDRNFLPHHGPNPGLGTQPRGPHTPSMSLGGIGPGTEISLSQGNGDMAPKIAFTS